MTTDGELWTMDTDNGQWTVDDGGPQLQQYNNQTVQGRWRRKTVVATKDNEYHNLYGGTMIGGRRRACTCHANQKKGCHDGHAVVATAIAGVEGGEIEFDTRNLQAEDVRCSSSPRWFFLCPSIIAPNFSDDNEEIIGPWIWRSSRMARRGSLNNSNGAT